MSTLINVRILGVQGVSAVKIICLEGQMDESNLEDASKAIDGIVEDQDTKYMIFDFEKLEYMNSRVIGYFASLYSTTAELGKKLMIVKMRENMKDVLSLVGLITIIDHYDTLEEAFEIIKSDMEQEGQKVTSVQEQGFKSMQGQNNKNI